MPIQRLKALMHSLYIAHLSVNMYMYATSRFVNDLQQSASHDRRVRPSHYRFYQVLHCVYLSSIPSIIRSHGSSSQSPLH